MNKLISGVALSFTSFTVFAEMEQKFDALLSMSLEQILEVEVATGTTKALPYAPSIVSVITADDIALTGARNLAEVLEQVPGLHVIPSLNRMTPLFAIRGIFTDSTPQVLVLIDGVETSELTALSVPYTFYYPTQAIERIEIIRGPGSAVYGADAFSGVINIITKTPDDTNSATVGARVGSFSAKEAWVNANTVLNKVKLSLSVTQEEQGNDSSRITPYGVMSREREMTNIHLNLNYGNINIKNWYWRSEQQMGVGAGIVGNDIDRDISENWRTQVSWQGALSESLEGQFDAQYSEASYNAYFQLFPPGIWPVGADGNIFLPPFTPVEFPDGVIGHPLAATHRTQLNGALIYSDIEDHRIRVGFGGEMAKLTDVEEYKNFGPGILDVDHLPENRISSTLVDVTGTPFAYTPAYDRDLWYLSLQDEWRINDKLELTSGIRYDHYSDFDSTVNPRLALVWRTTDSVTSKLLFGTAFRAPKVAELAFINNPTVLGNPDLDPEKIRTLELAIDYRPNDTFLGKLNVFGYQAEDLIQLNNAFTYQNLGEQDAFGIEIEINWQASERVSLIANSSWIQTQVRAVGSDVETDKERIPGFSSYLDMRYQVSDDLVASMQNHWVTNRERQVDDLRPAVEDYMTTDLNLIWTMSPQWEMAFGVKNLFNDQIIEPVPNSALFGIGLGFPDDYPMLSRNVFGSVTYQF